MGKLFGGSKSKSKQQSTQVSYNQSYQPLLAAFQPLLNYAQEGASKYSAFLKGDRTGFDNYLKNSAYDFDRERGEGQVATALSSKGLRNSGAMLKGLTTFNNDLQQRYSDNYLNKLAALMGVGSGAAGVLSGAGGYSSGQSTGTTTSSSKPGLGGLAGSAMSGWASGGFK